MRTQDTPRRDFRDRDTYVDLDGTIWHRQANGWVTPGAAFESAYTEPRRAPSWIALPDARHAGRLWDPADTSGQEHLDYMPTQYGGGGYDGGTPGGEGETMEGGSGQLPPRGPLFGDDEGEMDPPDGGLYGLYGGMARGKRTPYELSSGLGWRSLAGDPMSEDDASYLDELVRYGRGPLLNQALLERGYRSMTRSGYSPAEAAAIVGENQLSQRGVYDRSRASMERRAGLSGNSAGYYANLTQAGRDEAKALGEAATKGQVLLADEKERRKEKGLAGLTELASLSERKKSGALDRRGAFLGDVARRRIAGLEGMDRWSSSGRNLQREGASGLSGLYDRALSRTNAYLGGLLDVGRTKREDYQELGETTGDFNVDV